VIGQQINHLMDKKLYVFKYGIEHHRDRVEWLKKYSGFAVFSFREANISNIEDEEYGEAEDQ